MILSFKSKKTKNLKGKEIHEICKLKSQFFKYGLSSQKKWFYENIKSYDIHNLLFINSRLAGYTCLRLRKMFSKKRFSKYFLFDSLIIDKNFKKKNFSYLLMNFNSFIIKNNLKLSFLICDKALVNFYKKFNWKLIEKKRIKIFDHKHTKKLCMILNLSKVEYKNHKNIVFYTKR